MRDNLEDKNENANISSITGRRTKTLNLMTHGLLASALSNSFPNNVEIKDFPHTSFELK